MDRPGATCAGPILQPASDGLPAVFFAGAIDRVDEHLVQARVFQCHHVLRFTFRSTCEGLGLELVLTRILEAEELHWPWFWLVSSTSSRP